MILSPAVLSLGCSPDIGRKSLVKLNEVLCEHPALEFILDSFRALRGHTGFKGKTPTNLKKKDMILLEMIVTDLVLLGTVEQLSRWNISWYMCGCLFLQSLAIDGRFRSK